MTPRRLARVLAALAASVLFVAGSFVTPSTAEDHDHDHDHNGEHSHDHDHDDDHDHDHDHDSDAVVAPAQESAPTFTG